MRPKNLIVLVASIALVLVLVLTGCGQTPSAPSTPSTPSAPQVVTKTVEVEKTYRAVNPAGIFVPVETKALAPRLDTLDNKTIWVCQAEADPVIMPALWERLQKEYPKTTWKRTVTSSTSPVRLTAEEQKTAQAVIVGIGW